MNLEQNNVGFSSETEVKEENVNNETPQNQVEQPAVESAPLAETTVAAEAAPVSEPVMEQKAAEVAPEVTATVEAAPEIAAPVAAEISVPAAAQTESTIDTPAAEAAAAPAAATHTDEEQNQKKQLRISMQEKYDKVYKELLVLKENNQTIDVEVKERIRGGLRVIFEEMPLFLPASHFSLKRTPSEQELQEACGKSLKVHIHELQEYDEGRKAVIVSRKQILLDDFWGTIQVGDIVEGKVSSIASFGVFLDLGGVEGLIHISRLSQVHVDDPNRFVKKGDIVKAVVVELEREKNRIALSRKELEDSPWKDIDTQFPIGTHHVGIVRRLTEFGAYIELKPGVDGLLRTPEISWTKRIKKPSDVLKPGQELNVEILSVSEEKKTVSLSYKKTLPNPWGSLVEAYPVGSEYKGIISQVMPQGAIVSINDEIDGFMPRSKMRGLLQGNKIPFHPGDTIDIIIADLIPEEESLILAPKEEIAAQQESEKPKRQSNSGSGDKGNSQKASSANAAGISFLDMLSDNEKKNLFGSMDE